VGESKAPGFGVFGVWGVPPEGGVIWSMMGAGVRNVVVRLYRFGSCSRSATGITG